MSEAREREETVQRAVEAAIRIGIVALLLLWVFQIVAPFVTAILWGAIIAVALRDPYHWLERVFWGRRVVASVVFALALLVLLIIPAFVLTGAIVDWARGLVAMINEGRLAVPPAPESVRDW